MTYNKDRKIEYIQQQLIGYMNATEKLGIFRNESLIGTFLLIFLISRKDFEIKSEELDFSFLNYKIKEFLNNDLGYEEEVTFEFNQTSIFPFLNEIKQFSYNYSELKELLDFIVNQIMARENDNRTPQGLVELVLKSANIKENNLVLDPAVGTGGFLRGAEKYLEETNIFFKGIELNKSTYLISFLYSKLTSLGQARIENENSFDYLQKVERKFDIILANPPIKKVSLTYARSEYGNIIPYDLISSDMSVNFIETSLAKLEENGRALFLINLNPLFSSGVIQNNRKHWIENGLLKAVVSFGENLLPNTSAKFALLIFEKSNKISRKVKLINADECFTKSRKTNILSKDNINTILEWITLSSDGKNIITLLNCELEENSYNLLPAYYLQKSSSMKLEISQVWKKISCLSMVYQGNKNLSKLSLGEIPIIQGRDLRTKSIDILKLDKKDISEYNLDLIRTKKNDLLIQRIGNSPFSYVIGEGEDNLVVSDTVFIIRFKENNLRLIEFICEFFNSDEGRKRFEILYTGVLIGTLSKKKLLDFEVPIPNADMMSLVQEINKVEESLRDEHEKVYELKKSFFTDFKKSNINSNFNQVRLTAHALETALLQKDDIQYKISNLYPFPIASLYRDIFVEKNISEVYEKQLRLGEHVLSFMASVSISISIHHNEKIDLKDLKEKLLNNLNGGISPGHWVDLLTESTKLLKGLERKLDFASEFCSLLYKGKRQTKLLDLMSQDFTSKLNDFKHHRGPSNKYEKEKFVDLQNDLILEVFQYLDLFIQCDLLYIHESNLLRNGIDNEIKCSILKGDHPAFKKKEFLSNVQLKKDTLYLNYKDEYICLYPMMDFIYDESTKKEQLFTFDKKNRKNGNIILKSFESQHIENKYIFGDLNLIIK